MSVYLSTAELSMRIKYDIRYIRENLKDNVFKKGIHYIKPFGGRKILFIWDEIEKLMLSCEKGENPIQKIILKRR